jgi:hypothetical protein
MNFTSFDRCRSCGARIFWALTAGGKSMPVDADHCPDGNIEIECASVRDRDTGLSSDRVMAHVVGVDQFGLFPAVRYKSHFATCPNAEQFRKAKK